MKCVMVFVMTAGLLAFTVVTPRLVAEDGSTALRERPLLFGVVADWSPGHFPMSPDRYRERLAERFRDVGATATLIDFDWSELEPEPGEYRFDEVDRELEWMLGLGLEVVGRILGSPAWTNTAGRASAYHPPRESLASDFTLFCERLGSRYRGRVDHFQFWDAPGGPEPDPARYLRWLWSCKAAIRRGNPAAVVATGGLRPGGGSFLRSLYAAGGKQAFDAVAVDGRPLPGAFSAGKALDEERIEGIRQLMVENGDEEKPVWVTTYWLPARSLGIQQQAECVTQALDFMAAREWITVGILKAMADPPGSDSGLIGLCDEDLTPRPAYRAFARYTLAPAAIPPERESHRFARPEGTQLVQNSGFEQPGEHGEPAAWIPWGGEVPRSPQAGETGVAVLTREPHSGRRAAVALREGEPLRGGLYQTVQVEPGTWLAASVWTYVSFTHLPPKARIGVNLAGNTDPGDAGITWSEWYTSDDPSEGWEQIGLCYPVRIDNNNATVFLEWSQPIAVGWSAVGFDDVRVSAVQP